jgi:hypothetical protein
MTEQILSAGVYNSENDQSFYTQGASATGLAVVGPTEKGAAFIPTDATSYSQYNAIFGSDTSHNYTDQSVYNYLQAGNSAKIIRVLGNGGWQYNSNVKLAAIIKPSVGASSGGYASSSYATSSIIFDISYNNSFYKLEASGSTAFVFYGFSGGTAYSSSNYGSYRYFETNTLTSASAVNNLVAAINSVSSLSSVSASYSGGALLALTASVPGIDGNFYRFGLADASSKLTSFSGGTVSATPGSASIAAVLYPTQNDNIYAALNNTAITGTFDTFKLTLPGAYYANTLVTASLNPESDIFISKVLGTDATHKTRSIFPYLLFGNSMTASGLIGKSTSIDSSLVLTTSNCTFTSSNSSGYDHASTPWVLSDSGDRLFKFHHLSDGFKTNKDVKVAISNITKGSDANTYSTFDVQVRVWNDIDRAPSVLEQYIGVTLNPDSANYIVKAIGDKYKQYDENQLKVIDYGDYANISIYIRIEPAAGVTAGTFHPQVIPNGYEALYETVAGFSTYRLPAVVNSYSNSGSFVYSGFDYSNVDNINYLNPVPSEAVAGNNTNFTKPTNDNKFLIPFQGGTDGMNYVTIKKTGADISADGTNVFGFDLSSNTSAGTKSYRKALDIISNNEEFTFDLLTLPGVLEEYHGSVTSYAQSTAEERTDCVYIRDLTSMNATIPTAIATVAGLDSSYSAVYYPWVKVKSIGSSKDIIVPPSVAVPEVYAYNDSVSAPWFAPAGLSRGIIAAVDTRVKLNKADRDALYSNRINPICKFPNTGVTIWGQKTLQIRDTALNRINVRRLLIDLRTYISNVAKNFVFDNNTVESRNKLVNLIVPYMESVQTRQGLYAFRVDINETLNTNDVIDRNQLVGKIFVSPAKSIEFILLEFNVTATGAIFQ